MELPIKEIVFEPGKTSMFGLFAMSVVENPAIKEHCVYFSEHKTQFSVNEESRIILGPALIPNMLVYRNQGGSEFNLTVSASTIEKIAVDFAENNRLNNVNPEHEDELLEGVIIFQSLITNENTIPSVKGYEHLPTGTLFYGAKVKNDQVWNDIKAGKYKGWSIHAAFEQKLILSESIEDKELDKALDTIFNTQ